MTGTTALGTAVPAAAGTRRGPLTHGQLSQLRDTASLPPEGRAQANVWRVMPLPPGLPVALLRHAAARVRDRHEALRTTYDLGDPGRLEQVVHPAGRPVGIAEVPVPPGADPAEVAADVAASLRAQVFDLGTEEPWRLAVVLAAGRPTHLVTVIHHIAADMWSEDVLAADFGALLSGGEPAGPADSPLEVARAQHTARGQADRRATEAYLAEVYRAAAGAGADVAASPRVLVNAVLDSRVAPAAAARRAAQLRAGAPSLAVPGLLLAAFCAAAHRVTGVDTLLVSALSNNRLYPGAARLVGNMVQWARLVSRSVPGEPFEEFARRIHDESVRAYRFGCYDVDADERIRAAAEREHGPIRTEVNFNYVQAEPDPMPPDAPDVRIRAVPAPYLGGPGFYLVAYHGSGHLELTGRTRWEGVDHAAMEAFLAGVHELLLPVG